MTVAPASIALSTWSHSAEVVFVYPTSLRDWIRVLAKKRGTVALSFSMRLRTALPPRGASELQFGLNFSPS
jgi:hypothetical protein